MEPGVRGGVTGAPAIRDRLEAQSYRERSVHPRLAPYASCVWVQHVPAGSEPYRHRTVPNGVAEIACRVGSEVPLVIGPRRFHAVGTLDPGSAVVGIRFRPGAAPSILGVPAPELVDREIELDRLWGRRAFELAERLGDASTSDEAMARLETMVGERASPATEPDPLVVEVVDRLQPWRGAGAAAASLFISERQLRRRCVTAVGLGPKALHRILRFQGFLALVNADGGTRRPLAELAARSGYADQAHLSRECSNLSGLTPRAFVRELAMNCSPTHDHRASFAHAGLALLRATAPV